MTDIDSLTIDTESPVTLSMPDMCLILNGTPIWILAGSVKITDNQVSFISREPLNFKLSNKVEVKKIKAFDKNKPISIIFENMELDSQSNIGLSTDCIERGYFEFRLK